MTTTTTTQHIVVGWNSDYEQAYVHEAAKGEADGTTGVYEADVPADLWKRYTDAADAHTAAARAVVQAAGFDEEQGCMAECCPSWRGHINGGHRWFSVMLAASDDENTWPRIDANITSFQTQQEAEDFIAGLPEVFRVHQQGARFSEVRRDRLSVKEGGFDPSASECYRCGWSRREHADEGQEDTDA